MSRSKATAVAQELTRRHGVNYIIDEKLQIILGQQQADAAEDE